MPCPEQSRRVLTLHDLSSCMIQIIFIDYTYWFSMFFCFVYKRALSLPLCLYVCLSLILFLSLSLSLYALSLSLCSLSLSRCSLSFSLLALLIRLARYSVPAANQSPLSVLYSSDYTRDKCASVMCLRRR